MSSTNQQSIIRSFIVVPMIATSLSLSAFTASVDQFVATSNPVPVETLSSEEQALQVEREEHAAKIDTYFKKGNMPLAGYGMKMVLEAEKHGIPWNLIPAISVRESTGGRFACKTVTFSAFGWGSCRINFKSYDHAIETLAEHLGGNNPRTSRYYDNKSVKGILQTYNPPSVVPTYAYEVMGIMNKIDKVSLVQ